MTIACTVAFATPLLGSIGVIAYYLAITQEPRT